MKTAKDYYSTHMVSYEEPDSLGFMVLEVLPMLKGMKWDDEALAIVHSLRPSCIRVTDGRTKCDARTWRVTVYVDEENIIHYIEQEVEVGCPEGIECGQDLYDALYNKENII